MRVEWEEREGGALHMHWVHGYFYDFTSTDEQQNSIFTIWTLVVNYCDCDFSSPESRAHSPLPCTGGKLRHLSTLPLLVAIASISYISISYIEHFQTKSNLCQLEGV